MEIKTLFGADDALLDDLLKDCYINKSIQFSPIIIGRWGIGKSAVALHCTENLDKIIQKLTKKDKRLWYIGENNINRSKLAEIKKDNELKLVGSIESLWKAEIIRTECILLATLHQYYGSPSGAHWDTVEGIANTEKNLRPMWDRIPEVFEIVFGSAHDPVIKIQQSLEDILSGKAFDAIVTCLNEIATESIQPIIVIEPIDTPNSGLENDEGIAQAVVTSLLNVFYRDFLRSQEPTNWLRICIPWHRWKPDRLDFPQKIDSYTTCINWNTNKLKEFIDARIKWEFSRIGRKTKDTTDYFSQLFVKEIKNDACTPEIIEDSFLYILRHTHHRPRDLQRMVRHAVLKHAEINRISPDEVLSGKDGLRVTAQNIKESIREVCEKKMLDEFFNEMGRKYSKTDMFYVRDLVSKIPVPFKLDHLIRRHESIKKADIKPWEIIDIEKKLWESGLIGIEITPQPSSVRDLLGYFGREGFRQYDLKGGATLVRWYFFEYNYNQPPSVLLNRFEQAVDGEASFVLHPSTFEFLLPIVSKACPIGA